MKVVSGGQTGVDRGALDAAMAAGVDVDGWCPPGRSAEDGRLPELYPLKELSTGTYRDRTLRNVEESDGTVILYFGEIEGGTEETLEFCLKLHKPYKLIDAEVVTAHRAAQLVKAFVSEHGIGTLNVAGPRASKVPQAYDYAYGVIREAVNAPAASAAKGGNHGV